jgi:hypothetical protein
MQFLAVVMCVIVTVALVSAVALVLVDPHTLSRSLRGKCQFIYINKYVYILLKFLDNCFVPPSKTKDR